MSLEGGDQPNVIVVDAGDVFVGGRYHSLVPILRWISWSYFSYGEGVERWICFSRVLVSNLFLTIGYMFKKINSPLSIKSKLILLLGEILLFKISIAFFFVKEKINSLLYLISNNYAFTIYIQKLQLGWLLCLPFNQLFW